jgi:hypothetical protein
MEMSHWNTQYSYLKQIKILFFFTKTENKKKAKQVQSGGLPEERGGYNESVWEGEYGGNVLYTCM